MRGSHWTCCPRFQTKLTRKAVVPPVTMVHGNHVGIINVTRRPWGIHRSHTKPLATGDSPAGRGSSLRLDQSVSGSKHEWIDSSWGISRARVRIASSASFRSKLWVCILAIGVLRDSSKRIALV